MKKLKSNSEGVGRVRALPENSNANELELCLTPAEIAKNLSVHASTVRRLFRDEPGVCRLGKVRRRDGKRDYVTLRIPLSVYDRVMRRHGVRN